MRICTENDPNYDKQQSRLMCPSIRTARGLRTADRLVAPAKAAPLILSTHNMLGWPQDSFILAVLLRTGVKPLSSQEAHGPRTIFPVPFPRPTPAAAGGRFGGSGEIQPYASRCHTKSWQGCLSHSEPCHLQAPEIVVQAKARLSWVSSAP